MAKRKSDRNNNGSVHSTRIFKRPDDLYKAFEEYKDSLIQEAKKWPVIQYVGRAGEKKVHYPKLPLVMEGFYTFCHKNYGHVHHYFDNKEGYYDEFGVITRAIKEEIRQDQVTGGLLQMYNPNLTARINNIKERTDNTTDDKPLPQPISYKIHKPKED